MYIENIFQNLSSTCIKLSFYDQQLVQSFNTQIISGLLFTEKQANLIVKLLKKYKTQLNNNIGIDITSFLENPIFKNKFRVLNSSKTMQIVDHHLYIKAIKINYHYNDQINVAIKELRNVDNDVASFSYFDITTKSWFFALREKNLLSIKSLINNFQFEIDQELSDYYNQISELQQQIENYIPMIVKNNNLYSICNLPQSVQLPELLNFPDLLFEARKHGITIWDQFVEDDLLNNANELTINFLKNNPSSFFNVDLTNNNINDIGNIVKYLLPCLVIIPGGLELEKLIVALEIFRSIGIQNSEMSVLFRLKNLTDSQFNQYVKENKLNSPLTNETKVVFLSQHIPKTILSPVKKFNSVLNFNYINVHLKLATFIKNNENVINIVEKKSNRSFNFANL